MAVNLQRQEVAPIQEQACSFQYCRTGKAPKIQCAGFTIFHCCGANAMCRPLLTFPQVCVDAHVSGGSSQTLVFSVRDVFFGLRVDVFFRQAKVDDVNGVLPFGARPAHQEVLWLHVSVDQAPGVDVFHPSDLSGTGNKSINKSAVDSTAGRGCLSLFGLPVVWLS